MNLPLFSIIYRQSNIILHKYYCFFMNYTPQLLIFHSMILFHFQYLSRMTETSCFYPENINTRSERLAMNITTIPNHFIIPCLFHFIHQSFNLLPPHVVNKKSHLSGIRYLVFDSGLRIKRVGVVLLQ